MDFFGDWGLLEAWQKSATQWGHKKFPIVHCGTMLYMDGFHGR
jgi:hypothetical protein